MEHLTEQEKLGAKGLVREQEAAAYLKMAPGTLRNMRSQKYGPKYIKIGRLVRYRMEDLEKWSESQIQDPAA